MVWTVNEDNPETYDLYVHGVCVGEGMDIQTFMDMYDHYKKGI
jgi:hypothetical protein